MSRCLSSLSVVLALFGISSGLYGGCSSSRSDAFCAAETCTMTALKAAEPHVRKIYQKEDSVSATTQVFHQELLR